MRHRQTIIFNRLMLKEHLSTEEIVNKLSQHMYIDEQGLGLTSIKVDGDLLTCSVLSKTPSTIHSYNEEQGILENTTIYIFEEVEVIWDLERQLLYTLSSASKFTKAKQFIRECLSPDFCFSNVEFMQIGFIEKMRDSYYRLFITDLHIKKFNYRDDAYGKFCVHLENYKVGEELYKQYSNNLSKISLLLESSENSDQNCKISISPRNSVSIECEDMYFDVMVAFIKDNL